MSYDQMREEVESVFDTHAGPLKLTRVDFAVDIVCVPVWWFMQQPLVQYKPWLMVASLEESTTPMRRFQHGQTGR